MAQSLVELANELTLALVQTGNVSAEDIQETLEKTYATLRVLKAQEESGASTTLPVVESSLVDWRKSITKHAVTCLDCGQTFKLLTIRHLRTHGLDPRLYRLKYAIPSTQPLAAKTLTARRRQVVQETRLWEKSPRFRKGQARHGTASPEPAAETLPQETEEPRTAASAQLKRQRKTTPKKTMRKQHTRR
jgi:predicted transcriptional regulator